MGKILLLLVLMCGIGRMATTSETLETDTLEISTVVPVEKEWEHSELIDEPENAVPISCEPCSCIVSTMDCSGKNLHSFAKEIRAPNITKLDLSHNVMVRLSSETFIGFTNLHYLSVSDNKVESVDADSFGQLVALERLDLSGNAVKTMPGSVLSQQSKLQGLYLRHNRLTDVDFLSKIKNCSLEILQLSINALSRLPFRVFGRCTFLREIWLNENKISEIDEDAFEGLNSLTVLDLSSNRLTQIEPVALKSLTALSVIDLSRNQLVTIDGGLFETTKCLRSVFLAFNWLRDIPEWLFSNSKFLRRVDLSNNLIEHIAEDAFTVIPSQEIPPATVTHSKCVGLLNRTANVALRHLDLSHNHLRRVPAGSFMAFPDIEELNLAHNLITNFGTDVVCLAGLLGDKLIFSGNRLACSCGGTLREAHSLAKRVAPAFQPQCLHAGQPWGALLARCIPGAVRVQAAPAPPQPRALPPPPPQEGGGRLPVVVAVLGVVAAVALAITLAGLTLAALRKRRSAAFQLPPEEEDHVGLTLYARAAALAAHPTASTSAASDVSRL